MNSRRQILCFLAFVYVLDLAVVIGIPHADINVLLAVFVPTVATALAIATTVPRGQRRAAWGAIGLRRSGRRVWLAAITIPIVLLVGSYGTALVVGAGHLRAGYRPDVDVLVSLVLGNLFIIGEEIGWRGFLLPRVRTLVAGHRGSLLTGFLHGLSHLPLILIATTYDAAGPRWFVAPMAVATITFAGVFYGWLWDRSGSAWAVSIGHNAADTVFEVGAAAVGGSPLALAYVTGESGVATLAVVGVLALWLSRRPAHASDCSPSWRVSLSSPDPQGSARGR